MKKYKDLAFLSRTFLILFVLSIALMLLMNFSKLVVVDAMAASWVSKTISIAFISMILTGIGTFSTLILGWRNEKRAATQTNLQIEKLELELAELKASAEEKTPKIIT